MLLLNNFQNVCFSMLWNIIPLLFSNLTLSQRDQLITTPQRSSRPPLLNYTWQIVNGIKHSWGKNNLVPFCWSKCSWILLAVRGEKRFERDRNRCLVWRPDIVCGAWCCGSHMVGNVPTVVGDFSSVFFAQLRFCPVFFLILWVIRLLGNWGEGELYCPNNDL